jgi:hypothetical protein
MHVGDGIRGRRGLLNFGILSFALLGAALLGASSASAADPVCVDRNYEVASGANLTLHLQEPEGPCSDADGQYPFSVAGFSPPSHGSISPGPNNTYIYRSHSGYVGPDSLTFSVRDTNNEVSNTARVDINVTPGTPNSAPVCEDAEYTVATQRALDLDIRDSCTDAENDTLFISGASDPPNGTVSQVNTQTARYRSDANFVGTDTFTYRVFDGGQFSNVATVTVNVVEGPPNNPPVCPETNVFVERGSTADVVGDCVDPDGDPVSYGLGAGPTGGRLAILSLKSVRYTPCTDVATPFPECTGATDEDSFSFFASDGIAPSDEVVVDIQVIDPGPGTVETNPDPTPAAPFSAAITTTAPGPVTIDERALTIEEPEGFIMLNQEFDITAPDGTEANPLRLVFTLDASVVPPEPVTVFRNETAVGDCTGAPGSAIPSPCVEDIVVEPDGDLRISVLTIQASVWNFGVAEVQDGDDDGFPDEDDNCPEDANEGQEDQDGDGAGDVCDSDRDGDGVADEADDCTTVPGGAQNGCPLPTSKEQCKGDGWRNYGTTFSNQGDCVSFVATGGKNEPAG